MQGKNITMSDTAFYCAQALMLCTDIYSVHANINEKEELHLTGTDHFYNTFGYFGRSN